MAGVLVLLLSEISYTLSEPHAGGLPRGGVGLPNGKPGVIVVLGTWHRQPEGQRSAAAPADASQGPISCRKIRKPLLGSVQIKSKKCGNVGCPLPQLHSSFYSIPLCNSLGPRSERNNCRELQDLDRILGLPPSRPLVVEEEVDQFLASGRVSDANLKRLLRRAEARLLLAGARSDAGYSGAQTERSQPPALPPVAPVAPAQQVQSARGPARPEMPSVEEEDLLKWSQVAKLAKKDSGEAVPWKEGLSRSMCRVPLRRWNLYHSCRFDGG